VSISGFLTRKKLVLETPVGVLGRGFLTRKKWQMPPPLKGQNSKHHEGRFIRPSPFLGYPIQRITDDPGTGRAGLIDLQARQQRRGVMDPP